MRKVRLMLAQYEAYRVPMETTMTPSFRLLSSLTTDTFRSNLHRAVRGVQVRANLRAQGRVGWGGAKGRRKHAAEV